MTVTFCGWQPVRVRLGKAEDSPHATLYLQEWQPTPESIKRNVSFPPKRSLLVHNLPVYLTTEILLAFFKSVGGGDKCQVVELRVGKDPHHLINRESLLYSEKYKSNNPSPVPNIFRLRFCALVVFAKESGVKNVLKLPYSLDQTSRVSFGLTPGLEIGLGSFIEEYEKYEGTPIDQVKLVESVDEFMSSIPEDKDSLARKRVHPEADDADDDDASNEWKVVSGSKGTMASKNSRFGPDAKRKKKSKLPGHVVNLYNFQISDKKRTDLQILRAKFEADKARLAAIKATRKFKPL